MATAQTLITKAMRLIGVVSSGDAPTSAELTDGLSSLNSVIDMMAANPSFHYCEQEESISLTTKANYCIGNESVTISSITRDTTTATATTAYPHGLETGDKVTVSGATESDYNITASITVTSPTTFTYTVANSPTTPATGSPVFTSGDFYTNRPLKVTGAFVRSGSTDYPVGIYTEQYWTNLQSKQSTGSMPTAMIYRPNYPFGQIHVYPVPTGSVTMYIKSIKTVRQYSAYTDNQLLPPGYQHMMELMLASELATEFGGRVSQEVAQNIKMNLDLVLEANGIKIRSSKLTQPAAA